MSTALEFAIADHGPISREVLRHGYDRFAVLAAHVCELPYGRPVDGDQPQAVLTERRGTCSSKHRLLATVAHECGCTDIELVVGIYSMSEKNTPGVGAVLEPAGVVSIPEAHCYLRLAGRRYDFTGLSSGSSSPFDALLSEHVVRPARLRADKADIHQDAIRRWAARHGMTFAGAWSLREACIDALASADAPDPAS